MLAATVHSSTEYHGMVIDSCGHVCGGHCWVRLDPLLDFLLDSGCRQRSPRICFWPQLVLRGCLDLLRPMLLVRTSRCEILRLRGRRGGKRKEQAAEHSSLG